MQKIAVDFFHCLLVLCCLFVPQTIKDNLEQLGEQVTGIHERQPEAMQDASPDEVVQIGDNLTQLNAEWDRLNRMYNQRKGYVKPYMYT